MNILDTERCIETICIEEGTPRNLYYHNRRMNNTRSRLWQQHTPLCLDSCLQQAMGSRGMVKARVEYGREGIVGLTMEPYRMRNIQSLQPVFDDEICYNHKSTDRTALQRLLSARGNCDDIIIVKNNLLTDTSFSNIALYDGRQWFTPRQPLLEGTMRASLIDRKLLIPADISLADLHAYTHVALINAMIDLGRLVIPIDKIVDTYRDR